MHFERAETLQRQLTRQATKTSAHTPGLDPNLTLPARLQQHGQSMLLRSMSKHNPMFLSRRARALRNSILHHAPDAQAAAAAPTAANMRFRGSIGLNEVFSASGRRAGHHPVHPMHLLNKHSIVQVAGEEAPADPSTVNGNSVGAYVAGQAFNSFNRSSSTRRSVPAQATLVHQDVRPTTGFSKGQDSDAASRPQSATSIGDSTRNTQPHDADNKDVDADSSDLAKVPMQINRPQPTVCNSIKHADTFMSMRSNFDHLASIREHSKGFLDDDFGPSPFHSQQLSSEVSTTSLDDGE
jgi:hypothetical protein